MLKKVKIALTCKKLFLDISNLIKKIPHKVNQKDMKGKEPILQLLLKPSHMNFVDLQDLQELAPCKNHPLSPGPVQVKNPN